METLAVFSGLKRTHCCGELRKQDQCRKVTLMGWVNKRRDHGGLIFVDLRDRSGLIQVVFSPEASLQAFETAEKIRSEFVLSITGEVRIRPEGTENRELNTGEIEVYAAELNILNTAKTPPFYIEEGVDADENIRLKYRYLDLRRPDMQRAIQTRYKTTKAIRDYLDSCGFWEIETPMLTKSTPEGARDYLVPSRLHPGDFYALPQSPQLFKQLLMVAGMEKYFQIVRCFRDEDLRADRQPEFTQLDLEMSFVNQEDIISLVEDMTHKIFERVLARKLMSPFPRLTYREAMDRYGSDKPDLRFGLELVDVSDEVKETEFKVFAAALENGGKVKGLKAPGCGSYSRKDLDELTKQASIYGAKGLAWMIVEKDTMRSPIAKFFSEGQLQSLREKFTADAGDLLLFVADKEGVVADTLGHLRLEFGRKLGLIDPEELNFCWITDFPLLEYDETEKRYVAIHHPFTAPLEEDFELLDCEPLKVRAQSYDLVLNGFELGSGSIRIHRRDIQAKMFKALGLSDDEVKEKFGFLMDAFEYGTPPHGGMALGLDRIIMLMSGRDSIRDVIAFPKTQSAADLMTGAPGNVSPRQLEELHLRLAASAKKAVVPEK